MSVFVLLLLLLVGFESVHLEEASRTDWKCDEQDKDVIDDLATSILVNRKQNRNPNLFPESKDDLIPYCKQQSLMIGKLDSYKEQCMRGKQKQIMSVATYSMRVWNNLNCRNPESKHTRKLFESAACANEASSGYRACNNKYVHRLDQMNQSGHNHTNTIAYMCCGYIKVFDCLREVASPLKSCTEQHIEWHEKHIRVLFDNMFNVICAEYTEETNKCERIWRKAHKGGDKSTQQAVTGSDELKPFFNLIIDILSKEKNLH